MWKIKNVKRLVFEHCANFTSRLHSSVNFQPIATNEVSKVELNLFLSNEMLFLDIPIFNAEVCLSGYLCIYHDTL